MESGVCQRCGQRPGDREVEVQFSGTKQLWTVCSTCLSELLGESPEAKSDPSTCPRCGWTAGEFKKTKRLGCGQCYQTFHSLVQGWLRHEGYPYAYDGPIPNSKIPRRDLAAARELEVELQTAVREERYEEAVVLRDRLKRLQSESEG